MGTGTPAAGWSIDDFEVFIPPQNSVRPIGVSTVNPLPFPFEDQQLRIRAQNTGAKIASIQCKR
ncbi:MAG: hypothetical protein U5L96_05585 [Owenweeksia sp.]|nr:hypothetical protein [Owenweeksia sp.]